MDINEQINGTILLAILPLTLTFFSHAGGYLYYKPNDKYTRDLKSLKKNIYNDWNKKDKKDNEGNDNNNIELPLNSDIPTEIENYLKQNMTDLWNGEFLNMYQDTAGSSEDGETDTNEMRNYYNVVENNNNENKKVGAIQIMIKDFYYALIMILWPIISLISYLAKQLTRKQPETDNDSNKEEEIAFTNLYTAFKVFREKYLVDSDDDSNGEIKEEYQVLLKKLPFQALWILEGGIGSAIKLSWIAFAIFIVIIGATLYNAGGAFQFIDSLSEYQNSKETDLSLLIKPFIIYCIAYAFVIYMNKDIFKNSNGKITIYNLREFFKVNTFIMWNLLISFFLFSIQMGKSREFKDNYAFAFNLIILLIFLFVNLRKR